ncbi:MAG: hypothetical protein IJB57_02740 [Clostridia bacterium]|nr:hypothetical protein [Clostridia bacterium]
MDKTGNICFESTAPLIEISKDYIVERNNGIFIIYDYDGNKIYTQQQEGFKGDVYAVTKYSGISIIDNYDADDETDVSIGYEFIDGELKEFSKITSVNNEVVSYEYEDFSAERVMSAKTATGYVWVFEGVDIPIEYELFWVDGDYIILYKNESSGFSDYSSAIYDVKKGEIVGSIPYYIQIDGRIDKLEGYYYIKNEDDRGSEGWCVGVADINGNVIIEPIYETVIPFVS